MANDDSATLAALKTARDAVIAALASGESTVSYTIRNRTHTVEPSSQLLLNLEELIDTYERKSSRGTTSPFRLARLSSISRRGSS